MRGRCLRVEIAYEEEEEIAQIAFVMKINVSILNFFSKRNVHFVQVPTI